MTHGSPASGSDMGLSASRTRNPASPGTSHETKYGCTRFQLCTTPHETQMLSLIFRTSAGHQPYAHRAIWSISGEAPACLRASRALPLRVAPVRLRTSLALPTTIGTLHILIHYLSTIGSARFRSPSLSRPRPLQSGPFERLRGRITRPCCQRKEPP